MIPKTKLLFNDGRIGEVAKVTSPVLVVFSSDVRHIFAQDYDDRLFYVEVRGQVVIDDEIDWVQ